MQKKTTINDEVVSMEENVCKLDYELFNFDGLKFYSSKEQILAKLGKPNRIFEPNYECGGLSSDWQGVKYFTLDYGFVKFTGNEKEKYVIEELSFTNDETTIFYGKYKLSNQTSLEQLVEIFGRQVLKNFREGIKNGGFIIFSSKSDNGIRFEIEKGNLMKIQYWTPC